MKNTKRIAIISFYHEESSLCLAKHIAKLGYLVDYYYINCPPSNGIVPGFEFWRAKIHWGLQQLKDSEIPEIANYMEGLPVRLFLITYDTRRRFSIPRFDKITLWYACYKIRKKHYDAINIVGQVEYIQYCHKYLRSENITHTFHEIGSHQNNITSSPTVNISIRDNSKVILHSYATYQRFISIPYADIDRTTVIHFGKFETSLLYTKDIDMNIPLDLRKPTFLFFGMIKPYKGLDNLAEAIKILAPFKDKFNLIIAGKGIDPSLSFFESLSNCWVYNKFLKNDEMMHLISICSIVVLPYHSASQTGIIPTISLYGKPAIATSVGAFPEFIKNGKNGILIEKDNPVALAEAMQCVIDHPDILSHISSGSAMFGNNDQFDWTYLADKTISFLLED